MSKFSRDKKAHDEESLQQSVLTTKICLRRSERLYGEMSLRRNVLRAKGPQAKFPSVKSHRTMLKKPTPFKLRNITKAHIYIYIFLTSRTVSLRSRGAL